MQNKLNCLPQLLLATVLGACNGQDAQTDSAMQPKADMVFTGGAVYTVDASRSWAQAVALREGKIIYVGNDQDASDFVGASTRVIDLQGRMLMPSFQDSHIHPIMSGMQALAVDMSSMNSVSEYTAALKSYADSHPHVAWIRGGGWLMSVFGPGALASRKLLDAVVPDRPVYLESSDGHSAWVNSKALAIAGINKDTPDPDSGRIDRDPATGEAIGSLQEGAMNLVFSHVPVPDQESRTAGLMYAIKLLNRYGITGIQDAWVGPRDLQAYRALDDRGELSLRVVASLWWDRDRGLGQIESFKQQRAKYSHGNLRATSVKIMQDGVMENYTAALLKPYIGKGDTTGIPMVEPELLKQAVIALDAEGFQVHFHAIGDAAIRQCLDAVEAAIAANGDLQHRHHIAHLELIDPADIPRFRELGVIANFQPLWAYADDYITELTLPYIGKQRGRWLYPIKSVLMSGALIAFGSDWSVSTANPLPQIETAVTRTDAFGDDEPFLPQERIDLPEALAAFTINAAYLNHAEDSSGSIEVGKAADLIVLDHNLFTIARKQISDVKVLLTLLNGQPVYGTVDVLQTTGS